MVFLALREAGVNAIGDTIDAGVAQEALLLLNSIRAGLSLTTRNNEIYDQTFAATAIRQYITLGTDGTTPGDIGIRPAKITQVVLINPASSGINIKLPIRPYEEYRALAIQQIFAIPEAAYIDTSYPYQKIWFFPGLTNGWTVRVQGWSYMAEYENLSDPFIDPPEWFKPLYLYLACDLAPKYGQADLGDSLHARANSAAKPLKANQFMARMKNMPNGMISGMGNGFNFYAGM